jgi:hypothetical protein
MPSSIHFVLDALSTSGTMLEQATIDGISTSTLDVSAISIYYISETDIQNIFKVRTDSNDVNDISLTDLKHFIHMDKWPHNLTLNPVNGMMDQPQSTNSISNVNIPNKMLVKHDFIRYLAKNLFNTPQGVDLFNNERELVQNLNTLGNNAFQTDISSVLWKYSTYSTHSNETGFVVDDVTGLKATTNDNTSDENICWVLLNTLLAKAPNRFKNLENVIDSDGVFSLPIFVGDTINFTFDITPANNQHLLTNSSEIVSRKYQIKIVVDDGAGINTLPIDANGSLLSYSGNIQPVLGGITNDQYPYNTDNGTVYESLYIINGSGSVVFDANVDITDILLVGGGAGGSSAGNGGDGGEVVHYDTLISTGSNTLTFNITIGEGGPYDTDGNDTQLLSSVLNLTASGGVGTSNSTGTLFEKNNTYYAGSGGYVDSSGVAYDGYIGGGGGAGGAGAVYGVNQSGSGAYGGGTTSAVEGGSGGDGGTNAGGGNNNGYTGGIGSASFAGGGGGGGGGSPTSSSNQGGQGGRGGGGGDGISGGTGGLGRKLRAGGGGGGNGGAGTGGGGGAGGLGGQQGDHYIVGDAEDGKGGTGGSGVCVIVYKRTS